MVRPYILIDGSGDCGRGGVIGGVRMEGMVEVAAVAVSRVDIPHYDSFL